MRPVIVGVIGCGGISPSYLRNLTTHFSHLVTVKSVADIFPELAQKRAEEFGINNVVTTEELLSDSEIELVLNLTFPFNHYEVSTAILNAGKHLFSEKPLGMTRDEGKAILELAASKGLKAGGAADTFLGAGFQTCRQLIDDGKIGTPTTAVASIGLKYNGERIFKVGPLFDMGQYYLTGLLSLIGSVKRVTAFASIPFTEKPHPENSPDFGTNYKVDVPSQVIGAMEFENGLTASFAASAEAAWYNPRVDVFGTDGFINAPDANMYTGTVKLHGNDVELIDGFTDKGRGLGVAQMVYAIRNNLPVLASIEMQYHILDIMVSFLESAEQGKAIEVKSRWEKPEMLDYSALMKK
jgi:predicted dehydrogenase